MIRRWRRLRAIILFYRHVSAGKVRFYLKYLLAFVPGVRSGSYISDLNGSRRLNFHCNGGVFNLGHNNPQIAEAVRAGLDRFAIGISDGLSAPKLRLLMALGELAPAPLDSAALYTSGGEAVEAAVRLAKIKTGRIGVVSAVGAYHGGGGYAIAAGEPAFSEGFGPTPEGFVRVRFGDAAELERAVDENTAAVILETIPATLGMLMPPAGYLEDVRRICDRAGALYIADEVQTGLGRTGKLWGLDNWAGRPDMVVLGKGLSGGIYPIGALLYGQPLADKFPAGFIGRTDLGGADLGCLAALETLRISSAPEFLARVLTAGERLGAGLEVIAAKYPDSIAEIRRIGLFGGIKFVDEISCTLVVKLLFDAGIYAIYAGNDKTVLQFLPPLNISDDEIDEALGLVSEVCRKLRRPKYRIAKRVLRHIISGAV